MKDMKADQRRRYLRVAVGIVLSAASPIAAYSAQQEDTTALHRAIPKKQILEVKVRGDLSGRDVDLELSPGEISPVLVLPDNRKYRVKSINDPYRPTIWGHLRTCSGRRKRENPRGNEYCRKHDCDVRRSQRSDLSASNRASHLIRGDSLKA